MIALWSLDLALSDGGLVDGGQTGQWEWGQATMGPVGQVAWGTNLGGPYLHDTVDWVEVQLPDLSGYTHPTLVIEHWYEIRAGDAGTVEADGGAGFVQLQPVVGYPDPAGFVGSSVGWIRTPFYLGGLGASSRLRLVFTADTAVADAGWFVRGLALYDGDVTEPLVVPITRPEDTQDLDGPYLVDVAVTDDSPLASVTLWTTTDGGAPVAIPMTGVGSWSAGIPAVPPDTTVAFWVEADDGTNVGRWPSSGEASFRVFLAAPTGLSGPTGAHEVANQATLTWEPPDSPYPVLGYRVEQEGEPVVTHSTGPEATVPLSPEASQRFTVRAVYDAPTGELTGDASEPLQLDVEVPELRSIEPASGFQGGELYVQVSGASLYLGDRARLDLGTDIAVEAVEVIDVQTLRARIAISPGAREGAVPVTIGGTRGTFTFPDAFSIRDGAEAPRIRRIEPEALVQGDAIEIEIEATVPFASVPTITSDDDLVVASDVTLEDDPELAFAGRIAHFVIAADTRARIGAHTLQIDDGARPYTVDLEVLEYHPPLQRGCATGQGGALAALVALMVARRRETGRRSRP